MSVFPNWQKYIVKQLRERTGCIPWGYEFILRAAGEKRIDFLTFQDDFDLDKDLKPGDIPRNNFDSVAKEIERKYPFIKFKWIPYQKGYGKEKLKKVEELIDKKNPILVSIALEPFGARGWHIMPIVDATDNSLILLASVDYSGLPETMTLEKEQFVYIHNNYEGGKEIAFLEDK